MGNEQEELSPNCIAAAAYASLGFSVLPLKPKDKIPILMDWTRKATKDMAHVKTWWTKTPEANIGIACGLKSNRLIIVDVDNHNGVDGLANLRAWEAENGKLPDTVVTRSGSGGVHLWFYLKDDVINILNKVNLLEGVDVRGEGGQVCAPPSIHPNGEPYVFLGPHGDVLDIEAGINSLERIATADDTVIALISEAEEAKAPDWDGVLSDPSSNFTFYDEPAVVLEGGRDTALFKKIASLIGKGMQDNEVEYYALDFNQRVLSPPLPEKDVIKKVANRCRSYHRGHSAECEAAIAKRGNRMDLSTLKPEKELKRHNPESPSVSGAACNPIDAGFSMEGLKPLITTEVERNGVMVPVMKYTAQTVTTICENLNTLKGILCYNDFQDAIWLRGRVPWDDEEEIQDRRYTPIDAIKLTAFIEDAFDFKSVTRIPDGIMIAADKVHVNPVEDWLNTMPEWDGVERMDTLFKDMLGVEDSDYTREVTSLIFDGMIRRTLEPGCKFDNVPVLVGPQGCGKSTLCRLLCLEHGEWFKDDLRTFEGPEPARAIPGHLVIEIAELSAMKSTKQLELVKSFITSQSDSNRKMRQDDVTVTPRRCIFIGTTNTAEFLVDQTGNRRFFPLQVNEANRTWEKPLYEYSQEFLLDYMRAVWSEAIAKYDPDAKLKLSPAVSVKAEEIRARHSDEDDRLEVVREYLDTYCSQVGDVTSAWDICVDALGLDDTYLGTNRGKGELKAVGAMLQNSLPDWEPAGRVMVKGHRRKAHQRKCPPANLLQQP